MEKLKIDRTKLKTITNFAKDKGLTRQAVHAQIKRDELIVVKIDGVTFIKVR